MHYAPIIYIYVVQFTPKFEMNLQCIAMSAEEKVSGFIKESLPKNARRKGFFASLMSLLKFNSALKKRKGKFKSFSS